MVEITEVLDINLYPELHCCLCKGLLAVSPISIDVKGRNLCGRCERDTKANTYIHNVPYEKLASQFYFPCRFLSEGCRVNKYFNEIGVHEEKCAYQIIKCPSKTCLWSGISTELIIHYNTNHQELLIENNTMNDLLPNDDVCFMLFTNGFHFFVKWTFYESELKLKVNSLNFLNSDDVKFVCTLTTCESEKSVKISSCVELKVCTSYDSQNLQQVSSSSLPLLFSVNAELSENIVNKKLDELNEIKCPCCHLQMAPPILRCPNQHVTCLNCTRANYDFCGICVEDELCFTRVRDLELITVSSQYTCKWEGCGANFSFREIQAHEQCCSKRLYMCLLCYQWYGFLNEVTSHHTDCPSKKCLWPILTDSQVTVSGTNTSMLQYSLLAFHELFWIIFKPSERGTEISVMNYGPVSCLDWYCYEITLQHTDDSNVQFNKTLCIKNKSFNGYNIKLPISDTAVFGGGEFYKIIVKIILLNEDDRLKSMATSFRRFK